MKRSLFLVTAMAAGLATSTLAAQAPAAAAAPAPPAAPQALPAKIAVISFQQAVLATNEGQKAFADIQKKYEPKKNAIEAQSKEVDSLQKQLQALPATTTDEERQNRLKAIDTKQRTLQRDVEDAQNAMQTDEGDAFSKLVPKVGAAMVTYAQANGFTMVLNSDGGQQQLPNVLWFTPAIDISQAVVNAYNTSSGVAAPPPSAPAPAARKPATPPGK